MSYGILIHAYSNKVLHLANNIAGQFHSEVLLPIEAVNYYSFETDEISCPIHHVHIIAEIIA